MSRLSLRDSITIILLILLTFALSFGTAQYSARKEIGSICDHKVQQDLNYMLTYIDRELGEAEQAAKTFCTAVFDRGQSMPDTTHLFRLQQNFLEVNPNISSIAVGFDDSVFPEYGDKGYGQIVVNRPTGFTRMRLSNDPDFRTLDWYTLAIYRDERRWCKPFYAPHTNYAVTSYSVPIYSQQDHLLGVVAVSIRLSHLDSLLNEMHPFEGAVYSAVLNSDLTYILHPIQDLVLNATLKSEYEMVGEELSDDFLSRLGGRESGKEHVVWEGRKKTVYYAPVKRSGCSVLLTVDDEMMFRSIAPNQKYRIIFSAIGLLITFGYLMVLVYRSRHRK